MIKKLFIIFLFTFILYFNTSCTETSKVKVNFIFNTETTEVSVVKELTQNREITVSDVPLTDKSNFVKMYYDNQYQHPYNKELIKEDTTIYVNATGEEYLSIDNETKLTIKETYLDYLKVEFSETTIDTTVEDIVFDYYYGNYNEAYVIEIKDAQYWVLGITPDIMIEDITFTLIRNQHIMVYKDHAIYTLKDAYDNQIITKSDLEQIKSKFDFVNKFFYENSNK